MINLTIQIILIGRYLDNDVISSYSPTAIDAEDYSNRSIIWRQHGFDPAFSDLYRMPGYPFILLIFQYLFPGYQFIATKIAQMLLLTFAAVLLCRVLQGYMSGRNAFYFSVLFGILPIWHFVPVLIAESLTAVVVTFMVYFLSLARINPSFKIIFFLGICVSVATYLKPNNLLLAVTLVVFFVFSLNIKKFRNACLSLIVIFAMLSPWFIFANKGDRQFIGLTTTIGVNLYVGTGMHLSYDDSVLSNSAIKWRVDPENNKGDILDLKSVNSDIIRNQKLTKKSFEIWTSRPLNQIGYAFDKILIAFGFKGNKPIDYVFGLFNFITIISSLTLVKFKKYKDWGFATVFTILLLALQAAAFQADRRFIVSILMPFGLLVIAIMYSNYLGTLKKFIIRNLIRKK